MCLSSTPYDFHHNLVIGGSSNRFYLGDAYRYSARHEIYGSAYSGTLASVHGFYNYCAALWPRQYRDP